MDPYHGTKGDSSLEMLGCAVGHIVVFASKRHARSLFSCFNKCSHFTVGPLPLDLVEWLRYFRTDIYGIVIGVPYFSFFFTRRDLIFNFK
jgi:hypothetical protein